jgi:hypothetical protein
VRWWLQTNPPYLMSVDNASVSGMDFSNLLVAEPDLWMVHWLEGKGEIERIELDAANVASNLNGLRESFYDVTPYVDLFDQFLTLLQPKNLLLDQAKKVKIDLIKQLFESKRQMPFHYPIAAGDYWWDATDSGLFSSTAGGLQTTTVKVNEVIDRLNGLIGLITSYLVTPLNANNPTHGNLISQINSNIQAAINGVFASMAGEVSTNITQVGNLTITHINDTVLGVSGGGDTINGKLHNTFFPAPDPGFHAAAPGIDFDIVHNSYTFGGISTYSITGVSPGAYSTFSAIPWTNVSHVSPANAQWIPIGSTTPVNVTPDEQTAILKGIADRTNALFVIKNQKIGEVNALTTVGAVIAYDVLAGWPAIPVPPGYVLEAPVVPPSGGISIVGTPSSGGGGGIPEAPSNGVTYGRRNMAWNPALALSGDVLDGGTF